jgi:hypothetical protein
MLPILGREERSEDTAVKSLSVGENSKTSKGQYGIIEEKTDKTHSEVPF